METVAGTTAAYAELSKDFEGELISPEAPEYNEARRIFNGMIDRRPACAPTRAATI